MFGAQPSMMSLAGAGVYLAVLAACLVAAGSARYFGQQPWHWRNWVLIAIVFAALAFVRVMALEDVIRDGLRDYFRSEAAYSNRRDFQRPLAAALVGASLFFACVWFFRVSRSVRGRRNIAVLVASASAAGLVCLLGIRLISLHHLDAILYSGPVRLNWLLDIGASVTVAGAAAFYMRTVARNPGIGKPIR